jgi:hypothetical protein
MPKDIEMLQNTPKHHWVQWTRMYDSELWHPEIVHSGPKDEFFIFYESKVSEMLRNTPKHHFGSNGLKWMLQNFGTPKCSETLPNIIFGSNGLEWMFHNVGTPKLCI